MDLAYSQSSDVQPKHNAFRTIVIILLALILVSALILFFVLRKNPTANTNSSSAAVSVETKDVTFYSDQDVFGCGRYVNGGGSGYNFGTEYVIRSQSEYEKFQSDATGTFNCTWGTPAPTIDFTKNTLIGKFASGGGCTTDFQRSATRDDQAKKITYTVNVVGVGGCKMLVTSMNWVTIPSIPDDYTVAFSVPSEPKTPDPAPGNVIDASNDAVIQKLGQEFFTKYVTLQSSQEDKNISNQKQYDMNYKLVVSENPIEAYFRFNVDVNGKIVSEDGLPFPDCVTNVRECEFIKQQQVLDITKNAGFDGKGFGGNARFVWDKDFNTFAWDTSIGAPDDMRGCNKVQEIMYVIDANDGKILSSTENIQTDCSSSGTGVSTNSVSVDPSGNIIK